MLEELVFLTFFIVGCLVFAHFIGNSPITKVVETKVTGKRVRYQQSITASGNTYVPIKNEVFTIDTAITFDIPVSKTLWDKLESNDRILINKHLNGEYSFKKRLTG